MYKVGILGAENSHAMGFSQIFNGIREDLREEFDDIRVIAVGGSYPEANKEVAEKCGVEMVVESAAELEGKVDAIMVTARDGKYHAGFARPFIEVGLPAFVDKPFTSDPEEAVALARLAKEKGVPLCGGSSLKLCDDVLKMALHADACAKKYDVDVAMRTFLSKYGTKEQKAEFAASGRECPAEWKGAAA